MSDTRKALMLLAGIEKAEGVRVVSYTVKNGVCYYKLKGSNKVEQIAL